MNRCHMDKRLNQLPTWLWTNSTTLPPIYKMVWEAVREDRVRTNGMQTELLVDTNKVFPLLLTSQLPTEVLGHIWNLANQKYAGQLTEQELYIVLALVAAAQASYTFDSLDVLHLLPFPPTPYLNIDCLLNLQPVMQGNSASKFQSYISDKTELGLIGADGKSLVDRSKGRINNQEGSNNPTINLGTGKVGHFDIKTSTSSTTWEGSNIFKDANKTHSTIDKQNNVASESCDEFTEFQSAPIPNVSSIPMWDSKQGSAIGSRLANHNLGVKKPVEKSKKNTINAKSTHNNIQGRLSLVSLNSACINKDHPGMECLTELFPKCTIKSQSKTVILKDTVIRNNDLPKNHIEINKEHSNQVSETMLPTTDKYLNSNHFNNKPSIESISLVSNQQQDLMNLQQVEDKYSALRALVEESTCPLDSTSNSTSVNQSIEEFGDFVSAEQLVNDVQPSNTADVNTFADIFSDLDLKPGTNENLVASEFNFVNEVSQSFDNNLKLDEVRERSGETGKTLQKEDAISINSVELTSSSGPGALTRSGSVPSLDLKSFLPSNTEEEQVVEPVQQNAYWEWKQYMESCVLLLQVAASIFTSISSESVLQEVLNSAQGYNFLCNLAEVAAVCRRVNFSYKEMDMSIHGFDDLLMDIDRIWAEMEPFYANIPIVTELPAWPLHQGDNIYCSLCLTVITSGRVVYNETNYHATCANLWLNCVNNHLPILRHPFYQQLNVCSGNSHM